MKKKFFIKFVLVAFVCSFFISLLTSCKSALMLSKIQMKDTETIEIKVGEFSYDDKIVELIYSNGSKEEINLTADMIPDVEKLKFYKFGDQEVKVVYGRFSTTFKINVVRNDFSDIYKLEDKTFIYDGNAHSLSLSEELPEGATVEYTYGNSFTNVGKYDVVAVISKDGYNSKTLKATLTIVKAPYDTSDITFSDYTTYYDGTKKEIVAENVPSSLSVSYEYYYEGSTVKIAKAVDAGTYKVVAKFTNSNENFEEIPNKEATLTISKAKYDMSNVKFENDIKVYDGVKYTPSISSDSTLPSGVTVSYKTYNEDKTEEVESNANAAIYTLEANFTGDSKNYEAIESMTAKLVVTPQKISIADAVSLNSKTVNYDGMPHSLEIQGTLPEKVVVEYNKLNLIYAGTYEIVATFSTTDPNYETDIDNLTEYLIINKINVTLDMSADDTEQKEITTDDVSFNHILRFSDIAGSHLYQDIIVDTSNIKYVIYNGTKVPLNSNVQISSTKVINDDLDVDMVISPYSLGLYTAANTLATKTTTFDSGKLYSDAECTTEVTKDTYITTLEKSYDEYEELFYSYNGFIKVEYPYSLGLYELNSDNEYVKTTGISWLDRKYYTLDSSTGTYTQATPNTLGLYIIKDKDIVDADNLEYYYNYINGDYDYTINFNMENEEENNSINIAPITGIYRYVDLNLSITDLSYDSTNKSFSISKLSTTFSNTYKIESLKITDSAGTEIAYATDGLENGKEYNIEISFTWNINAETDKVYIAPFKATFTYINTGLTTDNISYDGTALKLINASGYTLDSFTLVDASAEFSSTVESFDYTLESGSSYSYTIKFKNTDNSKLIGDVTGKFRYFQVDITTLNYTYDGTTFTITDLDTSFALKAVSLVDSSSNAITINNLGTNSFECSLTNGKTYTLVPTLKFSETTTWDNLFYVNTYTFKYADTGFTIANISYDASTKEISLIGLNSNYTLLSLTLATGGNTLTPTEADTFKYSLEEDTEYTYEIKLNNSEGNTIFNSITGTFTYKNVSYSASNIDYDGSALILNNLPSGYSVRKFYFYNSDGEEILETDSFPQTIDITLNSEYSYVLLLENDSLETELINANKGKFKYSDIGLTSSNISYTSGTRSIDLTGIDTNYSISSLIVAKAVTPASLGLYTSAPYTIADSDETDPLDQVINGTYYTQYTKVTSPTETDFNAGKYYVDTPSAPYKVTYSDNITVIQGYYYYNYYGITGTSTGYYIVNNPETGKKYYVTRTYELATGTYNSSTTYYEKNDGFVVATPYNQGLYYYTGTSYTLALDNDSFRFETNDEPNDIKYYRSAVDSNNSSYDCLALAYGISLYTYDSSKLAGSETTFDGVQKYYNSNNEVVTAKSLNLYTYDSTTNSYIASTSEDEIIPAGTYYQLEEIEYNSGYKTTNTLSSGTYEVIVSLTCSDATDSYCIIVKKYKIDLVVS